MTRPDDSDTARDDPASPRGATPPIGSVSRRRFLQTSLLGVGATAVGLACRDDSESGEPRSAVTQFEDEFHCSDATTFFNPEEARAVEALTARILPGSPDDPGAREARVLAYIDCMLATGDGWGRPVYTMSPYVNPDDLTQQELAALESTAEDDGENGENGENGEEDPEAEIEATSFGIVTTPGAFERYGYQLRLTPPEVYRAGLASTDSFSRGAFGAPVADLGVAEQDLVVTALDDNTAEGFDIPSAKAFFETLRRHTIEGMFSDPRYSGNHDMAGWHLIGWPGAQRAYTPVELRTEQPPRDPRSMADLHRFNPGHDDTGHADLPVATRPR